MKNKMNRKEWEKQLQLFIDYMSKIKFISNNQTSTSYYVPFEPYLSTRGIQFVKSELLSILINLKYLDNYKESKALKQMYLFSFKNYIKLLKFKSSKDIYSWLKSLVEND